MRLSKTIAIAMNWIKPVTRTVTINFVIVMALIGCLVTGPIVIVLAYNTIRATVPVIDSRQNLPNYDDIDWTERYFKDHRNPIQPYKLADSEAIHPAERRYKVWAFRMYPTT